MKNLYMEATHSIAALKRREALLTAWSSVLTVHGYYTTLLLDSRFLAEKSSHDIQI